MSDIKPVSISLDKEKLALELKYLLTLPSEDNEQELISTLNKIHPFTQYPLSVAPPTELFQTGEGQTKIVTKNISKQLDKYSFMVISGGLCIEKGSHSYTENRLIDKQISEKLIFNINEKDVVLKVIPNSTYIRMHNVWIQMAKKKQKQRIESYVKGKFLAIPFFANLTFQEFSKSCKLAEVITLGPDEVLLEYGAVPYHMYIVTEGELIFERIVKFVQDKELWYDVKSEIQRCEDNTCELMFEHLVKEPRQKEKTFDVLFNIKSVSQGEIICARETLNEEKIPYLIRSSLKTKIICLKYPDLYNFKPQRLSEIRLWKKPQIDDKKLRKEYYYQMEWNQFKEKLQKENVLNKLQKTPFEEFLRKEVDLTQEKHYFFPNKVGEGSIIEGNPAKITKFKIMAQE